MHRPGVDYWANVRTATQQQQQLSEPVPTALRRSAASSSFSSGPPSLSRTSIADFHIPSDDVPPPAGLASSPSRHGPLASPSPPHHGSFSFSSPSAAAAEATIASLRRENSATVAELEETKKQLTSLLRQHQHHEEERVSRLQAARARESVKYANSLQTLQASLDREHVLRTTAEQERQEALREGQQLRAALRALLARPLSHAKPSGTATAAADNDGVPRVLYDEARQLLLRCEHVFAEVKMLQVKATDAAGLERLRCYDVPVLDSIPPTWPPETPRKEPSKHNAVADEPPTSALAEMGDSSTVAATPKRTTTTAVAPSPIEETPTGPEVSALTTVSPDTPCSTSPQERSTTLSHPLPNLLHIDSSTPKAVAEKAEAEPTLADTSSAQAPRRSGSDSGTTGGRGGARRVLLSPPVLSPSADTSDQQQQQDKHKEAGWSGPMSEFTGERPEKDKASAGVIAVTAKAAPATVAVAPTTGAIAVVAPPRPRLHPEPGSRLSEFEREDIIRDTDKLIRQLSRETVALAKSQGVRGSSGVAALCRRRGLDYIDPAFLPVTETLGLAAGGCRGYDPERGSSFLVQWCSQDTFAPHGGRAALLSRSGVDPNALRCGRLGDSGVVAAFAALAEAIGAVTSVLASTTSEEEADGLYVVWLCVQGWWTRVTTDAYLPCLREPDQSVVLYGCCNVVTHDLWAPVCEKALAKVYGSYQALPHLSTEVVLAHLTGGPVESWDWWQRCSDTALSEIEAAINTNARGAGIVLLTTHTTAALRDLTRGTAAATETRLAYERLSLLPGTAYRVLAVTENADGEALLVLRNWAAASPSLKRKEAEMLGKAAVDRRDVSPLREDGEMEKEDLLSGPMLRFTDEEDATMASLHDGKGAGVHANDINNNGLDGSGCVWLNYTREVLPLFEKCHVCFDCRRFHDARFPIFFVGTAPAVPAQLIRVRVRERRDSHTRAATSSPTRLWIGLHQPYGGRSMSGGGSAAAPWALKVTLIGQEEAPLMYCNGRGGGGTAGSFLHTKPAHRSYVLSESFMGAPQSLPAVWMYLELDPNDLVTSNVHEDGNGDSHDATVMEFFVVPQMELAKTISQDGQTAANVLHQRTTRAGSEDCYGEEGYDEKTSFLRSATDLSLGSNSVSTTAAGLSATTVAVVAILAEQRDTVAVDVVDAPAELRAAVYHDVVDRIDFSECVLADARASRQRSTGSLSASAASGAAATDVRCQLNGRCLPTFSW